MMRTKIFKVVQLERVFPPSLLRYTHALWNKLRSDLNELSRKRGNETNIAAMLLSSSIHAYFKWHPCISSKSVLCRVGATIPLRPERWEGQTFKQPHARNNFSTTFASFCASTHVSSAQRSRLAVRAAAERKRWSCLKRWRRREFGLISLPTREVRASIYCVRSAWAVLPSCLPCRSVYR